MKKEDLEDKTWKMSKLNKKHKGKRLKRQFIVFLFSLALIAIIVLIALYIYNKYECEVWKTHKVPEDEIFYNQIEKDFDDMSENINSYNDDTNNYENVYSIINKKFSTYQDTNSYLENEISELLEYDDSNDEYAKIYLIIYSDVTELYSIEVTDSTGNNLLIDENIQEKGIYTGSIEELKIKKIELDSIININVIEKDSKNNTIVNESLVQLDLSKDLVQKENMKSMGKVSRDLIDVTFEYTDSENVYESINTYEYTSNLIGSSVSVELKEQYGDKLFGLAYIDFIANKNVNNLTLEEAFNSMNLIFSSFGNYPLSDVYKLEITDEQGNFIEELAVNFDEMKKLASGEKIIKNGKEYTSKMILGYDPSGITYEKLGEEKIGNNIDAIKYQAMNNDDYVNYMFIYKDYIYEITCPTNNRVEKEVQEFLDSIELN